MMFEHSDIALTKHNTLLDIMQYLLIQTSGYLFS